jgi:hypothetical protein
MQFKLDLPLLPSDFRVHYTDKMLFAGSCFSEHIGSFLSANYFDVCINPFGILYHPIAIFNSINRLVDRSFLEENDLVFNQNLWHSWEHHGKFSHYNKTVCIENINQAIKNGNEFLKNTQYLFLTFGTSMVYELQEQQKIVSNCHKFPNTQFRKYFLSPDSINHSFKDFYVKLKHFNPAIKIICTISPVRHWRDGLVENNRSKSRLIYCVHEWQAYADVSYFPAYELMVDDLRDYRFYDRDLCHPNQLGIDYIILYFNQMYFDDTTQKYAGAIENYLKLKNHKAQFETQELKDKIDAMRRKIEGEFVGEFVD